jgi:hypothetical protein
MTIESLSAPSVVVAVGGVFCLSTTTFLGAVRLARKTLRALRGALPMVGVEEGHLDALELILSFFFNFVKVLFIYRRFDFFF